jgi:threonine/homoserine/homoserine lactone efflux protein
METILSLSSVLGALLIGAISPGPSFVLVARTAMVVSRIDVLSTAIGMGVGGEWHLLKRKRLPDQCRAG